MISSKMNTDFEQPVRDVPHEIRVQEINTVNTKEDTRVNDSKSSVPNVASRSKHKLKQLSGLHDTVLSAEKNHIRLKNKLESLKRMCAQKAKSVKAKEAQLDATRKIFHSMHEQRAEMSRQNSNAISTDNTGNVISTLSNMLGEISNSLPFNSDHREAYTKLPFESMHGVENVEFNSRTVDRTDQNELTSPHQQKSQNSKVKKVSSLISSKNIMYGGKKGLQKSKLGKLRKKGQGSSVRNNDSSPLVLKSSRKTVTAVGSSVRTNRQVQRKKISRVRTPRVAKFIRQSALKDLVELYHNETAVRRCDSSVVNITDNKFHPHQMLNNIYYAQQASVQNTPLAQHFQPQYNYHQQIQRRQVPIVPPLDLADGDYDRTDDQTIEHEVKNVLTLSKNYLLPTIASKLKRVAKYYREAYNVTKGIPFCVTASTSPSHNIGIRIQQVMGMLKNRQQPTIITLPLAYKIDLAERFNNSRAASLIATNSILSSKLRNECPLAKGVNYRKLKELAMTIPEEQCEENEDEDIIEEITNDGGGVLETQMNFKMPSPRATIWSDGVQAKHSCNCMPQQGVDLNQIVNKFRSSTHNNIGGGEVKRKSKMTLQGKRSGPVACVSKTSKVNAKPGSEAECVLPNAPKKLKEAFKKVCSEFESIMKEEEQLKEKACREGGNEETLANLDTLEAALNNKEQQVEMMMNLYSQIQAAKDQVKKLKSRTSKEMITKTKGKKMSSTTMVLRKLQQQIQHCHAQYKKPTK